jgi:hypothetical protein
MKLQYIRLITFFNNWKCIENSDEFFKYIINPWMLLVYLQPWLVVIIFGLLRQGHCAPAFPEWDAAGALVYRAPSGPVTSKIT